MTEKFTKELAQKDAVKWGVSQEYEDAVYEQRKELKEYKKRLKAAKIEPVHWSLNLLHLQSKVKQMIMIKLLKHWVGESKDLTEGVQDQLSMISAFY